MNYSNKAGNPYRIAKAIYENGPMTIEQCAKILPDIASHALSSAFGRMCCELELSKTGETFDIQVHIRRHFAALNGDKEVVGPRYAATFKPWSGKFSVAAAQRREPIREIGFLNGGTGFGSGFSL